MNNPDIIKEIKEAHGICPIKVVADHPDELYIYAKNEDFKKLCLALHKYLNSPVMAMFALDERQRDKVFTIYCCFMSVAHKKWVFAGLHVPQALPNYESLSKDMHSAILFEREIKEMYGVEPSSGLDTRRLNLHDEVWPDSYYPLRKDFKNPDIQGMIENEYRFNKVEGEGIFEVPVGPVHAGIIGPGHFRFSCAGEPIINLEIRLGFTHRGVEKLFEQKDALNSVYLAECVSGDSVFSHSMAFCQSVEKIYGIKVPEQGLYLRGIFLELERMYNHVNDIAGIAIDVGFSFPSAYAAIIKETILSVNEKLTGSRYLKRVNTVGGVLKGLDDEKNKILSGSLDFISKDFTQLKDMLFSNVSFMDRVDGAGVLKRKTAEDLGVVGLPARAAGVLMDLRRDFQCIYDNVNFNVMKQQSGDVLARLNMRILEFEESILLIKQFLSKLESAGTVISENIRPKAGFAFGYVEGWRGPVLYWIKLDKSGLIERCKIVDPSFHNWQALSFAVMGNIIPDFPLCNKSFDLSYSGNDL